MITTPTVLFVCVRNSGKSQMAAGLMRQAADGRVVALSAGTAPGTKLNELSVAALAEVGIDISGEYPKPWTEEILKAADVIITMGCGDACPVYPGRRYEDWDLPDLAGLDVAAVRPIRAEVETRVRTLLAELDVPTP